MEECHIRGSNKLIQAVFKVWIQTHSENILSNSVRLHGKQEDWKQKITGGITKDTIYKEQIVWTNALRLWEKKKHWYVRNRTSDTMMQLCLLNWDFHAEPHICGVKFLWIILRWGKCFKLHIPEIAPAAFSCVHADYEKQCWLLFLWLSNGLIVL